MKKIKNLSDRELLELIYARQNSYKEIMCLGEASEYLGCNPSYLQNLVRANEISRCKPMKKTEKGNSARVFFLKKDLDEFMGRNRIPSKYENQN